MKLGIAIGYSGRDESSSRVDSAGRAARYDSVWTAEAWFGCDDAARLLAAKTERIKLCTGIIQLSARTPASAAMQAATIDAMAGGGRVVIGIGVSGPQIVEGWYGQPWGRPYYRIKDYVQIMKKIWRREEPVTHDGKEIALPYHGPGSVGLGKPLKSILHMNPDIPIVLGTGNESTVRLTGEVADGWLPLGFLPGTLEEYQPWLEQGFERRGDGRKMDDFEVYAGVAAVVDDDVKRKRTASRATLRCTLVAWATRIRTSIMRS